MKKQKTKLKIGKEILKNKNLKSKSGITLIALVITIIVMLILVAVTVNVALQGGLIGKTQEAKTKTEYEEDREMLLSSVIGAIDDSMKVDFERLEKDLSEGWKVDKESGKCVSPRGNTFLVGNDGQVEDVKWEMGDNGEITYEGKDIGLKVGDYVNYEEYVKASSVGDSKINKDLYPELQTYSGYEEAVKDGEITTVEQYSEICTITKETDLKWRVLDVKNGQIRLISEKPTTSQVYLYGYNGYNNAVYLIDKVCSTLYTTEKGTAKNLKIEDIQDAINTTVWNYEDYENTNVDTGKYGGTKDYSGSYSCYPEIFSQEKKAWVDGKEGTLDLSEQNTPIEQTTTKKANSSIKITLTYWSKKMEQGDWKNPIYQNIFTTNNYPNSYNFNHWVTSRCVYAGSSYPDFAIYFISIHDEVGRCPIYAYSNSSGSWNHLRPVVSLNSSIQFEKVSESSFKIK